MLLLLIPFSTTNLYRTSELAWWDQLLNVLLYFFWHASPDTTYSITCGLDIHCFQNTAGGWRCDLLRSLCTCVTWFVLKHSWRVLSTTCAGDEKLQEKWRVWSLLYRPARWCIDKPSLNVQCERGYWLEKEANEGYFISVSLFFITSFIPQFSFFVLCSRFIMTLVNWLLMSLLICCCGEWISPSGD